MKLVCALLGDNEVLGVAPFLSGGRSMPSSKRVLFLYLLVSFLPLLLPRFAYAAWNNSAEPLGVGAGVSSGSIQWGDYDNDGDLDLAVSGDMGNLGSFKRLIIFRNDGGGSFTNVAEPMGINVGVWASSIEWGDYDNDGDLDLAVSGSDGVYPDYRGRLIIFRNNGGNSFSNATEPMGANKGLFSSSIDLGDYDNDGDLDMVVIGSGTDYDGCIIYRNDGTETFTKASEPMGANVGINQGQVQWGDYDNDGDLDLVVTGQDGPGNQRLIIYRNNGNDSFTKDGEPMGVNIGLYASSVQWGDYDGDGDLDLAASGWPTGSTGSTIKLVIFRNNGSGIFSVESEPKGTNSGVRSSSIQWGDYDNDGDLDLAVSGLDSTYRLILYRNDGGGVFTNVAEPMGTNKGVGQSSIQWGDYDRDGDLDLAVSGNISSGKRFILFRSDANGAINSRPAAPNIISPKSVSYTQGDSPIVFIWNRVTSDATPGSAITYNIRVGSKSGGVDIISADTDSAHSVDNTILGNIQNDTFAILKKSLPIGTYYWSIQAVDGGMMRSIWANEETFSIRAPVVTSTIDTTGVAFAFVRRGVASPPPQSVFASVSNLPVLQIVMVPKANGTLTSLKVTSGGSGNDAMAFSASGVKLWQDGDGNGTPDTQVGSGGSVTSDNGSVTFSNLSVPLTKDKPLYLVITYSFAGTANAGQTFFAQITSAADLSATSAAGAPFKFDGLPAVGDPVTAVSSLNTVPSIPTSSTPTDSAVGVATIGEITISGYSDANGDTHKCTQWQVTDSTTIFDNMHMRVNVVIPAETAGLRFKFPRGLLKGAQKHYWRARFCDWRGGWSNWSTARNFTTAAETLAITPTINKTLDSNPFAKDTRPIGFKLKGGGDERLTTLGGVKFEDEVSDTGRKQKPSTSFKFGLLVFTCENVTIGGTVTISLNMPESVPVTAKYFIFDASTGWIDMTSNLTSMDGDSEVFLTMTDGGTGDLDGVANGAVVDPGGFEISDGSGGTGTTDGTGGSSTSGATIKYPAACIVSRIVNSPWLAAVLRSMRDQSLQTSIGRKLSHLYYR